MCDNLAYEDEVWEELIDGEAVLMSPRPATNHIRAAGNIYRIFGGYLEGKRCEAFPDGMDLYLTEKNRLIPDMMVVCDRGKIKDDGIHGAPDLVVEVLSPSSMKRDRMDKKKIYQKCGVREYWIVNPMDKSVAVYHLEDGVYQLADICAVPPDDWLERMGERERAALKMEVSPVIFQDLTVSLKDIFRNVP